MLPSSPVSWQRRSQAEADLIAGLNPDEDAVDARVGAAVKTLWADSGIQAAYDMRSKFQLNDSAA